MLEKIKLLLPDILNKFNLKTIGIFGSYANGTATNESDVDILVEFEGYVGWSLIDLKLYLENVLEKRVDLVTPSAIKPSIGKHILKNIIFLKK